MVITLIGYRACGKSSLAPKLAKRLGWTSVDCDQAIEERAGRSIPEIFAAAGEAGFRKLETEVLADLLLQPHTVIASGGGAVLAAENRRLMKAAGPVVWLHVSEKTLVARLSQDRSRGSVRPSLTGRPIDEEVREVLAQREPCYKDAASIIIRADNESRDHLVRKICHFLRDQLEADIAGEFE